MTQTAIRGGVRRLSPNELEQARRTYARDGMVVFKNIVPKELLAQLHVKLTQEFEHYNRSGALFSGGGLLSGHLNCLPGEQSRLPYEALQESGVVDFIRSVWPEPLRMPNVGCNFNLPGSHAQHYHMDGTYKDNFMVANITVVDTDLVNGAIDIIPGTHKEFYPYWRFATQRVARNHMRLPSDAGDVLVRVSNVWHRGMPNHSALPRPMLNFTWEDGGSVYDDPFQVDGGSVQFRPNWFRPTRLGRIRERIFVTAPVTYSAYRFVDSLMTNKGYALSR